MATRGDPAHEEALRKRLIWIIKLSGLEIAGFAELVGISLSHLYAILNGNRKLTEEMARRIARKFKLKSEHIFDLDYEITDDIRRAPALVKFMVSERDVPQYFQGTKDARKASYFVEHELIHSSIFKKDTPIYLWEVREFCVGMKRYYSSNELSKYLQSQVKKGNLRSKKRPIKRRDGSYGTRLVDVYFKSTKTGESRKPELAAK